MPVVVVNQSGAGTTTLVTGLIGKTFRVTRVVVTLSAAGTLKFNDTANDLCGPFDISATGGFVMPGDKNQAWVETGSGNPLNIVTTGGAARGLVDYFVN